MNNVNVEGMQQFTQQIAADPAKARRTQILEGAWVLDGGGPQFRAKIKFEGGETVLETDNPTFMGGGGTRPGPMHYCFYGLASCYTGVFVAAATSLGVELTSLTTRVEADVNFSRVFGVGTDPIMEEIRVILTVVSDAPEENIREAERLALERCPVVFTLRNVIKLTPSLQITR